MLRALLVLSLLIPACAHEPRHALIDQILVPVPSMKPLLCNRAYDEEKKDFAFQCYDLRNGNDRVLLWKLKFICKVGKKMYAVHPGNPTLVRNTVKTKDGGFWHSDKKVVDSEYLGIETQYDFLVASAARCFSQERYSFDMM